MNEVPRYSMAEARRTLRAALRKMGDEGAADFVEWERFERELEAELAPSHPSPVMVKNVFARHVNRARRNWREAMIAAGAPVRIGNA